MKNDIPIWAVFPMIFGALMLMFAAIVLIALGGPLAFDILGGVEPKWLFNLVSFGSAAVGVGCGILSTIILRELFS